MTLKITATEDFKNLFAMHHFAQLINKPTREMNNSKTVIENNFVMYLSYLIYVMLVFYVHISQIIMISFVF